MLKEILQTSSIEKIEKIKVHLIVANTKYSASI